MSVLKSDQTSMISIAGKVTDIADKQVNAFCGSLRDLNLLRSLDRELPIAQVLCLLVNRRK